MLEQDYIMRLIKEMVRALLKLLFHIDAPSPTADMFEDIELKQMIERLLMMSDDGNINEAEQELFDMADKDDRNILAAALVFYSYLNNKEDAWLTGNGFSREEIWQGLGDMIAVYGIEGFEEIFSEND